MHTLQYIAVEAEDKEKATMRVHDELESSSNEGGTWFDWLVIGGGRFTAKADEDPYQYTDKYTISYVSDTSKFHEVLKEHKELRKNNFITDLEMTNKDIVDKAIEGYLLDKDTVLEHRLHLMRYRKMLETILGYWSEDSYYYDLETYDHEFEGIEDRIKTNPTMQFLVPVDFHF